MAYLGNIELVNILRETVKEAEYNYKQGFRQDCYGFYMGRITMLANLLDGYYEREVNNEQCSK